MQLCNGAVLFIASFTMAQLNLGDRLSDLPPEIQAEASSELADELSREGFTGTLTNDAQVISFIRSEISNEASSELAEELSREGIAPGTATGTESEDAGTAQATNLDGAGPTGVAVKAASLLGAAGMAGIFLL